MFGILVCQHHSEGSVLVSSLGSDNSLGPGTLLALPLYRPLRHKPREGCCYLPEARVQLQLECVWAIGKMIWAPPASLIFPFSFLSS